MQWLGAMQFQRLVAWCKKSFIAFGVRKPAPMPNKKMKRPGGTGSSKMRGRRVISLMLMLPLSNFTGCVSRPVPVQTVNNRPCYQWVITKDQEVYVYDNGHLIARLETEPYDAVISGWCVMRNNEELVNEVRRLSR